MSKYLYLEENKIVFANGVFALGYKLELPEKYSLGKDDYISLNEYWNKALKDLPIGSIFYKQDVFLKTAFDSSNFRNTNFLENATQKHFDGMTYIKHDCYLFFILPSQEVINHSLINPFKKLNKKDFDGFDKKIDAFIQSVSETVQYLNSIKLQGGNRLVVSEMEDYFLKNYYDLYFNLFDESKISDRIFNHSDIIIGTQHASLICMLDEEKLPDTFSTHRKDKYLSNDKTEFFKNYGENFSFDLDFSHIYNQICVIDDNRKHLDDLRKRNEQLKKSSSFDKQNKYFADVTDGIIQDLVENIDTVRMIRGHNNIIVIADSEQELSSNVLKVNEQFRDIDVKPYVPTGNYLNALYNNSFPFFSQYLTERQLYIASLEMFCTFLNNTGNYKNENTGILYNSRLANTPVYVDTWDDKKKNINARNFFILAPTGFGKSFNANHIISSYYSQGTKIVIIDLGGSYKKLSALFPNDIAYITYESGKSLGINAFDIKELTSDILDELVENVGVHYRVGKEVSDVEKTSLRMLIEHYYKVTSSDYSLPNFVLFIKNNSDILESLKIKKEFFNRDEFLHLMSAFTEDGSYSFLYAKSDSDIGEEIKDKKIIVFELDKAKDSQLLLTVMLQLVYTTIDKVIWRDKANKGVVLFDEVAESLKWDGVLGRIGYYFQAIRKQNAAVGIVLQSESQLPVSPISKAIVENTQVLYVLGAKDFRSLQNRFGLSEHAYYQLCSIQSDFSAKRPYSELFIMRGKIHQVYRLETPKQVYWAYQTEGADNQKLLDIYDECQDMEKAINQFLITKN
jgi:conjugal transfer ATP-binding protein TraC